MTDSGTEVLVLHRDGNVSSSEIDALAASEWTEAGQPRVTIAFDDKVSEEFYRSALEDTDRNLAIIADGKVRAVPAIAATAHKGLVLTPTQVDKVRLEPRSGR